DWSSDVCSSDLEQLVDLRVGELPPGSVASGGAVGDTVEVCQPAQALHPVIAVLQGGVAVGRLPVAPEPLVEQQLADTQSAAAPSRSHRPRTADLCWCRRAIRA